MYSYVNIEMISMIKSQILYLRIYHESIKCHIVSALWKFDSILVLKCLRVHNYNVTNVVSEGLLLFKWKSAGAEGYPSQCKNYVCTNINDNCMVKKLLDSIGLHNARINSFKRERRVSRRKTWSDNVLISRGKIE